MRITRGVSGTNASPTWTAHIRSSWGCDWPLQFFKSPQVILRGREYWLRKLANADADLTQMRVSLLMTRLAHLALSPSKPLLLHFVTFENKSAAREATCSTFTIH